MDVLDVLDVYLSYLILMCPNCFGLASLVASDQLHLPSFHSKSSIILGGYRLTNVFVEDILCICHRVPPVLGQLSGWVSPVHHKEISCIIGPVIDDV